MNKRQRPAMAARVAPMMMNIERSSSTGIKITEGCEAFFLLIDL